MWTKELRGKDRDIKVCTKGKIRFRVILLFEVGGSLTRVLKGRGSAKEGERQGFIAMKSAVMGTNQRFHSRF